MPREITQRQIETAKRIIQIERSHRTDPSAKKNHHDISNRTKRIKEMEFLEGVLGRLWEENYRLRHQSRLL